MGSSTEEKIVDHDADAEVRETVEGLDAVDKARNALAATSEDPDLTMLEWAVDAEARGWNPEPGTKLIGRVLLVASCSCGGFGEHPLMEVVTPDGEAVDVHAFHEVLRHAVERWRPRYGDKVAIKYFGRLTEGGSQGTGYENYRMLVIPGDKRAA